ncbi:MAG: M36 family metallopeptidase, partial [Actinomycetota bacterium]
MFGRRTPRHRRSRALVAMAYGLVVSGTIIATTSPSLLPASAAGGTWIERSLRMVTAVDHLAGAEAPTTTGAAPPSTDVDLAISSVLDSPASGATHVYVQEEIDGIGIVGAISTVTLDDEGEVVHSASRRTADGSSDELRRRGPSTPTLTAIDAVDAAADVLGLEPTGPARVLRSVDGPEQSQVLSDAGIARSSIGAQLVWVTSDDEPATTRLAWELMIDEIDGIHWWLLRLDAETGAELDRFDMAGRDRLLDGGALATPADGSSYEVFAAESPTHAGDARATVNQPAVAEASPFGWHDTDGVSDPPGSPDSTTTFGNNADVGTDLDDDDVIDPGSRVDAGDGLDFVTPYAASNSPAANRDAAVVNAFYWTNLTHDILHGYGFDEAAGNFQIDNYDRGGIGGDPVVVHVQDSASLPSRPVSGRITRNNANFATPPDGYAPRMQLYLFDGGFPSRDSALDAGVVTHEYVHGLSDRLTGGPAHVDCLDNAEQAGEGWSDLVALLLTSDGSTRVAGIGTYVGFQPTNGDGIRGAPYGDLANIPRTGGNPWDYTDLLLFDSRDVHSIGARWAQMLWAATWLINDQVYGGVTANATPPADPAAPDNGFQVMMQLVVDALKIQPCSPGFVDARDAILQADALNYDGRHTCLLWQAFAAHNLGVGASQGNPNNIRDGVPSSTMPNECTPADDEPILTLAAPSAVNAGERITATATIRNGGTTLLTNLEITVPGPAGASHVSGTAECGGTLAGSTLTMTVASLAVGATESCAFELAPPSIPFTTRVYTTGGDSTVVPVEVTFAASVDTGGAALSGASAVVRIDPPEGQTPTIPEISSITPARLLDTRTGQTTTDGRFAGTGRLGAGQQIALPVAGRGWVPGDATAAVLNITAVQPAATGFFTVHACEPSVPVASSLNFAAGINVANEVVAELDGSGEICVFTSVETHVIVDVVGFVPDESAL